MCAPWRAVRVQRRRGARTQENMICSTKTKQAAVPADRRRSVRVQRRRTRVHTHTSNTDWRYTAPTAPADRRREVRVERRGEAVVVVLWRRQLSAAKVERRRHAPRRHDADLPGDACVCVRVLCARVLCARVLCVRVCCVRARPCCMCPCVSSCTAHLVGVCVSCVRMHVCVLYV